MARYGVFYNGELLENEVFDTRAEAEEAAEYDSSCASEGRATFDQFRYSSRAYRDDDEYEVRKIR